VGGEDQPLTPAEYDAVTEAAIGSVPEAVEAGALPRSAVGAYRVEAGTDGPVRSIGIYRGLKPDSAAKVTAHEMGHMIDELVGQISTEGLMDELRLVYNELNNPDLALLRMRGAKIDLAKLSAKYRNFGPEAQRYSKAEVPRELMAEALRAYIADPNYLKTVAPKTAAAIRAAVNPASKTIQFNSTAPLGAAPLGAGLLPNPKPTSDNSASNAMHPSVQLMLRNPRQRQAIEQALAARGRGGDRMIAHLNPAEALMLRRMGGSGTINPRTGLREFTTDPRGDIGGGNNHDNQPGNDAGMGGDVGNGSGSNRGGHVGGSDSEHRGQGGIIETNQPRPVIQQPPAPPPIVQPPAPIPVSTAPMMSTTAATDLTGGRFGKLPGWDLKPYQIGTAPTSYPTPGLTTPNTQPPVTQATVPPPTGGGHPTTGGGGNGGLGGLGGDPNHPFGGDGSGSRNPWNRPGGSVANPGTQPGSGGTGTPLAPGASYHDKLLAALGVTPKASVPPPVPVIGPNPSQVALAKVLGVTNPTPATHLQNPSVVDGGGIATGPLTGLAGPNPSQVALAKSLGVGTGPVTGLLNTLTGGQPHPNPNPQPQPQPQPHPATVAPGGLGGLGGFAGLVQHPVTTTAATTTRGGGTRTTAGNNRTATGNNRTTGGTRTATGNNRTNAARGGGNR